MKQAVIFGAGNIGRGFIGQLFSESGYFVTFVDVNQPLIDAINQAGSYPIHLVDNTTTETVVIDSVRAISASGSQAVADAIATAEIGATAVGVNVLPHIAPAIAQGIIERETRLNQSPLNLIVCENLKGAANHLRSLVLAELPNQHHQFLTENIGFVDTVIARMVPSIPPHLQAKDSSLIIVEPYKDLPVDADGFINNPPKITHMLPHTPFEFYTDRKLYIHNAGHAVLGYLGYLSGYKYGYDALRTREIFEVVQGAMRESQQAIEKKYDQPEGSLDDFVSDLLRRFKNSALGDTNFRLGRDPIRKLGRQDRLIGGARNAIEQDIVPKNLVKGIVAGLRFDPTDDPIARQLQQTLQQNGIEVVLDTICGLSKPSRLRDLILQAHASTNDL